VTVTKLVDEGDASGGRRALGDPVGHLRQDELRSVDDALALVLGLG
jgi:hypothetical protein